MPTTTRYVQNHNNLLVSLGSINQQERAAIKAVNLTHNGRPRLILEICRMHAGKWIGLKELQQINPQRFSGEFGRESRRYREMFTTLNKHKLIEHNPEDPTQFQITPLGIKYLYCKKILNTKNKMPNT